MKTHFYVDFYFILNFMMNLFLILVTAMLRQKRSRFGRMVVLSCLHAAVSCVYTYLLWEKTGWQTGIAVVQMVVFVRLAFEKEGLRSFLEDSLVFFFLTFFTGGLIGAFQAFLMRVIGSPGASSGVWLFPVVFLLFLLFFMLRWEWIRQEHSRKSIRMAVVCHGGCEASIRVLYDTGNQLVSPYTGEGVAIISTELAEKLSLAEGQNPVLIPYHSIGGDGLLKAYRMEYLRITGGGSKRNFLAAVSSNLTGEQGVQMILNIT